MSFQYQLEFEVRLAKPKSFSIFTLDMKKLSRTGWCDIVLLRIQALTEKERGLVVLLGALKVQQRRDTEALARLVGRRELERQVMLLVNPRADQLAGGHIEIGITGWVGVAIDPATLIGILHAEAHGQHIVDD